MFTKSVFNVGVVALMSVGFIGCSQNSPSKSGDQPATAATVTGDYTPGTAVHNSKVVGTSETAVGSSASKEEIYAMYPELQKYASELLSITHVIETNTGDLELYSGSDLSLVLNHSATGITVMHSRNGFQAEKITHTMGSADQAQIPSTLSFDLKSCTAGKEQEQDQGADKGQEQDKGQDVVPAPDKGQDQDQGTDKGQEVVPETCEMINVTLSLSEEQAKQEQGQDQGTDKGQDQGADKGQDQDKGQEVVPAPEKDQDQDQEEDKDDGKDKA